MLRYLTRELWSAARRLLRRSGGHYRGPPPDVAFDSTDFEVEAVDGDTIKVTGVPRPIRLARVDTPEKGEPGAAEATRFVRRRIAEAETVEIEVDGRNLSDLLLEHGLAREVDW